jgi:hypothetical protein
LVQFSFNPKVGDFFPVFANFNKITGNFKTVTAEGLDGSMVLGRKSMQDPSTQRYHSGVIICASSDTACINDTPNNVAAASVLELSLMAVFALVAAML